MAELFFYFSSMNAGKSAALISASNEMDKEGVKHLLFTSVLDNRYDYGTITSRNGESKLSNVFDNNLNFHEYILFHSEKVSYIFVDEAQFLTKLQVEQLCKIVDDFNISVFAYGLRSDFLGRPFEGSLNLLILADVVQEISNICFCGRKAIMNARIDETGTRVTDGEQIEIGGNDKYIPLCRKHFFAPSDEQDYFL